MMTPAPVRSLIDHGIATGMLAPDATAAAREALQRASRDDVPWYLRVLIGGAAWVAALFLLGTLLGIVTLALGERVDLAAIVLGLGLMGSGVVLRTTWRSEFGHQAALVSVIAGQLLCVSGAGALTSETMVAALMTIGTSVVMIVVFDDVVYRFGAALAVIGALLVLAFELKVPHALGAATAGTALVPMLVWRGGTSARRRHRVLDPLAWASAVALCGLLATQAVIEAVTGRVGYSPQFLDLLMPATWPITALFVGLLLTLVVQVARDHGHPVTSPAATAAGAAAVIVGVLTLAMPAVTGALLLVMLGHDRRRTGLIALGGTCLLGFLGLYYYSLSLTLLQKSAVMIGSGGVCLAVAAFVHAQGRREAP